MYETFFENKARLASKVDCGFPYRKDTICYFLVKNDGTVIPFSHKNKRDADNIFLAYSVSRCKEAKFKLYAIWPGMYSSDLFIIDDIEAFHKAFEN